MMINGQPVSLAVLVVFAIAALLIAVAVALMTRKSEAREIVRTRELQERIARSRTTHPKGPTS